MKTFLLVFFATVSLSFSQNSGFGLGLVLNDDFGISGKYWLDRSNAFDFQVNLGNATVIGADYVWHNYSILNSTFPVYYGVGAKVVASGGDGFAINGVGGIDFLIHKAKLDVFLELVPTMTLSPSSNFDMNWNLGARYYF